MNAVAGPELSGDTIAWAQRGANGTTVLRRREPDGSTVTLFRTDPPFTPDPDERTWTWISSITASATRTAFMHGSTGLAVSGLRAGKASPTRSVRVRATLVAGPPGGPFDLVSGDPRDPNECVAERTSPGGFDLDGSVLALGEVAEACRGRSGDIRVTVAAPGSRYTVGHLESGPAHDVAVAGRYLGWLEPVSDRPAVAVHDWRARRLAYWLPSARAVQELELRRDGTALFAVEAGTWRSDLYVASPRAPRPRRILRTRRIDGLRVVGRRAIAILTWTADPRAIAPSQTRVVLIDLAGRVRTLARYGPGVRVGTDPDFDGRRAAWAVTRGRSGAIRMVTVP